MPNVNNKQSRGVCSVENCVEWVCAKGLCNKHYLRMKAFGDPEYGRDYLPRGLSKEERFNAIGWEIDEVTGCWNWRGNLDGSGYGQFHQVTEGVRRRIGVHRLSLELKLGRELAGEDANKEYAMHTCDNRKCVNPDHLVVGTHMENMNDMYRKSRQFKKISDDDVRALRRDRAAGMLQSDLATKYGLSQPYVSEVLSGSKRARVTEESK